MKTSFSEIIKQGWADCLALLRKPVWAIVLSCIFVFAAITFFGFIGSVSGTRFDFSGAPVFLFLMSMVFNFFNYGVVEGLLAEGPFLFIMIVGAIVYLVFRVVLAGLYASPRNAPQITGSDRMKAVAVKITGELMVTGLFLGALIIVFFLLSVFFNVSLGNAFFRAVLFTLFMVPVFHAGILFLSRGLKNRFALIGTGAGIVLVLAFLEVAAYLPHADGIWSVFKLIHSILQW
ncbi:MAG: hypothetical protein EHM28_09625, partial [Spirochaetaceae bacterium]